LKLIASSSRTVGYKCRAPHWVGMKNFHVYVNLSLFPKMSGLLEVKEFVNLQCAPFCDIVIGRMCG
jgi:hypothetical protein